jgi:hypothetical protein
MWPSKPALTEVRIPEHLESPHEKATKALGLPDIGGREWESRIHSEFSALHDSNLGDGSKQYVRLTVLYIVSGPPSAHQAIFNLKTSVAHLSTQNPLSP